MLPLNTLYKASYRPLKDPYFETMMKYAILSCLLVLASCLAQTQTVTTFEGIDDSEVPTPQLDNDPNGAVGTKQYMEWINIFYQGFDKTTFAPVWLTPQAGTLPWYNNGMQDCLPVGGDGIINFDRLASVWVIAFHTNPTNDQYYYCVAISNTDDLTSPTLAWYTYEFFLNPVLGANSNGQTYFPDWPKLGTWEDAYYATFDLEDKAQKYLNIGVLVCALDRTNMLLGNTPNPMQCFSDPNPIPTNGTLALNHSLIPADVEGTTSPPTGRDEFLASIQNPPNDGRTTTSKTINLWDFHVDWVTPTNSTFTNTPLTVPSYTPGCYLPKYIFDTYCAPGSAKSVEYVLGHVAPRCIARHGERSIRERGVRRSDPIDMKVPQVDGVRRGGMSIVRRVLDTYQEFVPAGWRRSRAFHIGRDKAVIQSQCAVCWNRIGVAETLHGIGRVSQQHVGAIERADKNTDVEILLGAVLQIKGGIVSVLPGAKLGPVGKVGFALRVGAKHWIQEKFIRVPGEGRRR